MVVSVRLSNPNDLTTFSLHELDMYRQHRLDEILMHAQRVERGEAKRALHQYMDAVQEQKRREAARLAR